MFVKEKHYRGSVLRKQREPDVVGSGDRPYQRVLVDIPDLEVLEEAPPPALFHRHPFLLSEPSRTTTPVRIVDWCYPSCQERGTTGEEEVLREVRVDYVTRAVRDLSIDANTRLPEKHLQALQRALEEEESSLGREVIERLLENAEVAREECIAFCQDTGYAVFFVEVGAEVRFVGGEIGEAIDEGVRRGYEEGYLRKSIVRSPVNRTNTGDNTPAIVYYDLVPGDGLKLTMLVKGAGCDNMSALKMLTPAEGLPAMKRFVVETIEKAGPNASPPLTVGVGIGGPFEKAAQLAKKALTRPSGEPNPDPQIAGIEKELLEEINATGIGPSGYGGRVTALAVHVESFPTHIAAFPVAVNLDCHSHRTASVEL
jgi:fumarate hydratase subunit alpha